jgi:hypothetical protein
MQKKLIIFIVALFILSSAYLLAIGNKFNDLNFGKDWWVVYFANPKDNDWNFVIENHSDNVSFHYTILKDKEKVFEGDAKVENGKTDIIKPDFASADAKALADKKAMSGKVTIEVSAGDEKKEIYKNF